MWLFECSVDILVSLKAGYRPTTMTKLLEQAITKVRELPDEDQEAVAAVMLSMAGADAPIVRLDDATRAAIREGIAQAERGDFVPDDVIEQADKRHGI
jgi:hypothetical protein